MNQPMWCRTFLQGRMKQDVSFRIPRDGFTMCPEERYGTALAARHDKIPCPL
jgi:hypothetical protein